MGEIIVIRLTRHVVWECRTCGCVSTCPEHVWDQQQAEGGYHSCPNGHKWGWSKESSEREQLRRERDRLKQQIAEKDDEVARQTAMRKVAEGKLGRMRGRINRGVCPCCHRTFGNLARHMTTKHADFAKEAAE